MVVDNVSTVALHTTNTGMTEVVSLIGEVSNLPGPASGLRRKAGLSSGVATINEAGQETGINTEAAADNIRQNRPRGDHHAGEDLVPSLATDNV